MDFEIELYRPEMEREWNEFVAQSRNGTFLFNRGYMDYHADRFDDSSLVARKRGRIIALLPANLKGKRLYSHQGLTYGGWVLPTRHFDCSDMMRLWKEALRWCETAGIEEIHYKPIPFIYQLMPSQEDLYALFRCGATQIEANISAAVNLESAPGFNTLQRRHLKKAEREGAAIIEVQSKEEIRIFHTMLSECLSERHDARAVHSESELCLLAERFPENIRIYMVMLSGEPVAGVCLYRTATTDHTQYICSTPRGREKNMLTLLFARLIEKARIEGKQYFDFGTSNENHGLYLNEGLYRQKSALGGSGVIYNSFLVRVSEALFKTSECPN